MSGCDQISQKFKVFYEKIDEQMSQLRTTQSFFSKLSRQTDNENMLNQIQDGKLSSKEVDELIESAKEFSLELDKLRQTVAKRKKQKVLMKSSIPPVWDEGKLGVYIQQIVEDIFDSNDDKEQEKNDLKRPEKTKPKTAFSIVKPILKTDESKTTKRNVSTNVKFLVHPSKVSVSTSKNVQTLETKSKKKVQGKTQALFKDEPSKKADFLCTRNLSGVEISKDKQPAAISISKTAAAVLNCSPTIKTSTDEATKSIEKRTDHDLYDTYSRIATIKKQKQMTAQYLPVLSMRGACSIQKIYQLEISPSRSVNISDESLKNTKFVEIVYQPLSSDFHHEPMIVAQSSNENLKNLHDKNEIRSNFIDIRDVSRMLGNFGFHLRDGKVHVVVEKTGVRRSNKKAGARKSLKPSALRKSIDELEESKRKTQDNEGDKINTCDIQQINTKKKIAMDVEMNEMDSSMSSSITDDGKLRQILKINRDEEKRTKSFNRHSSSDSYPSSVENGKNLFSPQFTVETGRVVTENFQSIYNLIEETFQPTTVDIKNVIEREIGDCEMKQMREIIKMSEENIKRAGMLLQKYPKNDEANVIGIEMETEKRQSTISNLLEGKNSNEKSVKIAVQLSDADFRPLSDEKSDPIDSRQACTTEPINTTKKKTADSSAQTAEDKNIQTDGNLNWKSRQYFGNVYEQISNFNHIKFEKPPVSYRQHNSYCSPLNPCECFGCEKRRSFQVSNYQSLLESGKSSPHLSPLKPAPKSPKVAVAYNPIYSDDDEVMKAANRFLRSIEKKKNQKNGCDITSSESSQIFSPQKLFTAENSPSISTPSSPLNNLTQNTHHEHQSDKVQLSLSSSSSPQLNLSDLQLNQDFLERYLSEGEVLSQGEIQLGLSDDDVPDDF